MSKDREMMKKDFSDEIVDLNNYYEKELDHVEKVNKIRFDQLVNQMESFLESNKKYRELFKRYDNFIEKVGDEDVEESDSE